MKKLIVILLIILFSGIGYAAPDSVETGNAVTVSGIDADFTYSTSCMLYGRDGRGVQMDWILFNPGGDGCYITIKDGTDAGPTIFYASECDIGYHGPMIIYSFLPIDTSP